MNESTINFKILSKMPKNVLKVKNKSIVTLVTSPSPLLAATQGKISAETKRVKHYIPASSAVEHVGFTWDFIEKQQQTKPVSSVLLALSAELLKVKVSAM